MAAGNTIDLSSFGILTALGQYLQAEKVAFTPSPSVAQEVMAQAQAGPPPGGDPAAGGAPPGMPPGGPPPGMDPAAAGGAPPGMAPGGAPPGPPMDPSAPPPGAGPTGATGPDPVMARLDQMSQQIQQIQQGGAGGPGANGKPVTASVKVEPHHIQSMSHDISVMKHVIGEMARMFDIKIPAQQVFGMQPPVSAPGAPPPAGPGGPAPQAQGAPPEAGGAPPSQVAQQLPALPPAIGKAASDRLAAGTTVRLAPGDLGRNRTLITALVKGAAKNGRK